MTVHALPYKPPWYPNQEPSHNPWAVADSMTGKTHYQQWLDAVGEDEVQRLIREHQQRRTEEQSNV